MAYIGNSVNNQGFTPAIDYFSGNGSTVTFTLSRPVVSTAQVIAVIENVPQNPSTAFTVSGSSITFTSAPPSGTNNIWVEYTSLITQYNAISQDPSVIGDITASGGFLSTGDFGNTFTDGTIVDYVTGNARITTGPADGVTIYNGGPSARNALMAITSAGNVGIGTTSPNRKLTLEKTGAVGFGAPYAQVGYSSFASGGYYTVGYGYTDATYTNPPVEIGAVATSASGGTTADIVFGTRSVTTNTAVTERMRIDSSGNVGVGTASPSISDFNANASVLQGNKSDTNGFFFKATSSNATGVFGAGNDTVYVSSVSNDPLVFQTNVIERMRIDSSGNLLVGTTTTSPGYGNTNTGAQISANGSMFSRAAADYVMVVNQNTADGSNYYQMNFRVANVAKGSIISTSSSTAYNTSSDYRLKENIAPMQNALSVVQQLKPCTYTWKSDGSDGQGFIAHELAEVVPDCVTGEKDAVNEDGSIKAQGIDTSFLVATLTAAIQEQQAIIEDLKARIETLEAK